MEVDISPPKINSPTMGPLSHFRDRLLRKRLPIRLKITLPYFFLSVLIAVGAAILVTRVVFDSIEERFNNQLIDAGKMSSEWMVRKEDQLLESFRLLTNVEGVATAVTANDAEQIRHLVFGIVVNNQVEAVEFLAPDGRPILSMRHIAGGKVEEYKFSKGGEINFGQYQFVRNVLKRQVDYIGDKYSGIVYADWGDYFYVSGPVYSKEGNFTGVVLVGISLQSLVRQLREETLSQVTLYNYVGEPLASTFSNPTILDSNIIDPVVDQASSSSYKRGLDRRELNISNLDYEEILTIWRARDGMDLGLLGSALAKTFLVSASRVTRLQITMLVASALLMVILVGLNVASVITNPLSGLVRAATQVAQGNLRVRVESQSHDEIEVLANSFNTMVSNLYRSQNELIEAYDNTLVGWSKALELRDHETEGHAQRVAELTEQLARDVGIKEDALIDVKRGVLLHDIGKMGIPDSILLKRGPLSDEEWVVMRKHPIYAYDMLKDIEFLKRAMEIPYCHHERWDGTGYPRGLKGEEIPLSARIFAVVDVYDALKSDRPYRTRWPDEEILEYISKNSRMHFDPDIVNAFINFIGKKTKSN